jgi:hypothetical protein
MPSTSWQWDPETKQATCCYCGFTTEFAGESPGQIDHGCDPAKHPPITARQGLPIGRSPRPEVPPPLPVDHLGCIYRGRDLRQERCETCGGSVRIKVFGCTIHRECQMDEKIPRVKPCNSCRERIPPA